MARRPLKTAFRIFGILVLAASVSAAPKLSLPQAAFNFGFVPQHAKVAHVFWLKSTGDDSLKILKITPGCGCTQVPLEKSELAPGDSTRLEVIFSTGNYTYRATKQPKILTNEGPPETVVSIICNVFTRPDSTYPLVIDPYKLDMIQTSDKARGEMSFKIRNVSDVKYDLSLVSVPEALISVELPSSVGPDATVEGTVKLTKKGLSESFDKSFTIQLSDRARTRFTVPIRRVIRTSETGDPSASPENH